MGKVPKDRTAAKASVSQPLLSTIDLQTLFLVMVAGLFLFLRNTSAWKTLTMVFVSLVLEALPFLLLGALAGGVVEVFVSREWLSRRMLALNGWMIWLAPVFGFVLPVFNYAAVPAGRRLLQKGVPVGAPVAYILGAPMVNPLVVLSTLVAYRGDWKVAAWRMGIGYVIAVLTGFLIERLFPLSGDVLRPEVSDPELSPTYHGQGHAAASRKASKSRNASNRASETWRQIKTSLRHGAMDFYEAGRTFVMAAFLVACLQAFVPHANLVRLGAKSGIIAIGLMMTLAMCLSVCNQANAFVAASFRNYLPLPAQMAFMVLGPMLDSKLLFKYLGWFRGRVVAFLAVIVIPFVLSAALLIGMVKK